MKRNQRQSPSDAVHTADHFAAVSTVVPMNSLLSRTIALRRSTAVFAGPQHGA